MNDAAGPPAATASRDPEAWVHTDHGVLARNLRQLGIAGAYLAMTLDDGPDRRWTPAALDRLADRAARANLFVIGRKARRNEELVRRAAADGHLIGIHTWDHVRLIATDERTWRRQVLDCRKLLEDVVQYPVHYLRPPYGEIDEAAAIRARAAGLVLVGWNVQADDWENKPARVIARVVTAQLRAGFIVLLHDGGKNQRTTVDAIPEVLVQAELAGLTPIRLDFGYVPELSAVQGRLQH